MDVDPALIVQETKPVTVENPQKARGIIKAKTLRGISPVINLTVKTSQGVGGGSIKDIEIKAQAESRKWGNEHQGLDQGKYYDEGGDLKEKGMSNLNAR